MLITLLLWIYQLFIILPFGLLFFGFRKDFDRRQKADIPFLALVFILGIAVLATVGSVLSVFINLGWQVQIFILLAAVSAWGTLIIGKRIPAIKVHLLTNNALQRISLALLIIGFGVTLISATTAPGNSDTGIYHAQAIRWIETYKAVPGLGNLHERFAYNSSWLVINALFSLAFLKVQSFHLLPSLLFLVSIIYFFEGIFGITGGSRKISDYVRAVFFMASFLLLAQEISSPGTDMPVTLIIWFLSSEWVRHIEDPHLREERPLIWLAFIAIFCTTIKLSSVPILLMAVWVVFVEARKRHFSAFLSIAIGGILILTPFIARNIILSGHLFYPGFSFDPIHVDWGIPQEEVEAEKEVIHLFALLPRMPREIAEGMTWQQQYKAWFYDQIPRHKAMLITLVTVPLLELLLFSVPAWRRWGKGNRGLLFAVLTMYCGAAFWLISAPTFRFGYGFILASIALTGVPLLIFILQKADLLRSIIHMAILLATGIILLIALKNAIHPKTLLARVFIPQAYPDWPSEPCSFANFTILCQVQYDSCWYDPFPCAISGNPNVEMRGTDYSDGFRYIQP